MERERSAPSQTFATGFEVETTTLTWTIDGFPLVRKSKSMIDSQRIEFTAGQTTGHPSQWNVYLMERPSGAGERWIYIYLGLLSPQATDPSFTTAYVQTRFTAKNDEGELIKEEEGNVRAIATDLALGAWGFEFIDADDANDCPGDRLQLEITFKLYTPSQPKSTSSLVEAIMDKFQVKFSEQLRKDFAGLLKSPELCAGIKIISNDKKEFTMQRGILAVRSDVFAALLSSDMIEANSGVIELPDMSSAALEVLLNFLNTGYLLQEWSNAKVIVELTNAAAKYQLQDLLEFLDQTIGKVCQLGNVAPLMLLARQLSLKVAEEELLIFVRKEGTESADNFIQICSAAVPGIDIDDDDESDEPQAKKQKVK